MAIITPDQATQLRNTIETALTEASNFVDVNHRYNMAFQIGLLIAAILVVILSSFGASKVWWAKRASMTAAIITGIATLLSTFAFQQHNFSYRQKIWEVKEAALISLRDELIFEPDAKAFKSRLDEVMSWNDNNPPSGLPPPTPAEPKDTNAQQ